MGETQYRRITDWQDVRILVTNDDGIYAPGLQVLVDIARELSDDVWVCAPEVEQSGAGHSLSINAPLRYQQMEERKFAVKGTPTDCVLYGIEALLKDRRPDLVLSGINRGANLGEDVTHSGTIAGAMEGTLCGVPSIALSQLFAMWDPHAQVKWELARATAPQLIRRLMQVGLPPKTLYNINFPDAGVEDCKGVRLTRQGHRKLGKRLDARDDLKGRPYYWIHWGDGDESFDDETDLQAVYGGHISITPLCMDLTNRETLERLERELKV